MKARFRSLMFALVAGIGTMLTACEEEIPFIILDQEAVIVGNETEKVNVDVRSNILWQATTEAEWCHVLGDSGNYKGCFEILVDANESVNTRVATVTVAGEGVKVSLLITQSGSDLAMTIPVPEYSVSNEAQPLDIKYLVTSKEVEVDAISEAMWAEVVSVKDGTCKMNIAENKTGKDREAAITFVTSYGNKPAILGSTLIKQSAKGVVLVIPVEEYAVTNEAQALKVSYNATDESAVVEGSVNCNWVTIAGVRGGVVDLTISENVSGEPRTAVLTLVTLTTAGEAVTASTSICQAATENVLDVVVDSVAFIPAGETITIPVVTNSQVSASCTSDWCTASVKGYEVAITAAPNNTKAARLAYAAITISSGKGNTLTKKVKLTQEPIAEDALTLPVVELNFGGEAESIKVPYASDAEITVKSSSAWMTASVEKSDVLVSVTENATSKLRQGYVTVTTTNGTTGLITVYQAPTVINTEDLTILIPEYRVLSGAGEHLIPFSSTSPVTARSNKEWCKVAVSGSDIVATVTTNQGDEREAFITLTTKTGVSGIVHLYQNEPDSDEKTDAIDVLVSEISFEGDGGSIKVPFTAETTVAARTSSDWISAKIIGSDVEVTVPENWSGITRRGYVTLQTTDLCAAVITVVQESNIPEMSFANEELAVDYMATTNYVPLTCSGAWKLDNTAEQMPNWITVTPTSGEGNTVITIATKTNKFARSRAAQLSFTNTDSSLSTILTITQDANPNGIVDYKHLGRGYDSAGKYAEESGVKASVLDCDLLADGNHIADILNPNSTEESISTGKTRSEYENSYSAKVGVSASYQMFTASVEANFSYKALGTEEYSFATLRSMTKKQILKIYDNETAADLKGCRSEAFLSDIKNLDAASLVKKYGTHVITGFSLGGVLEYSMAADASESSSEINWGTAVKAGFEQEGVGGASAEASYEQLNSVKNSVSGFESTMSCRGGQSQYTSNATSASEAGFTASEYSSWLSSLEDSNLWVMVDYEGSKLIPLWEFIDDAAVASKVKDYITKQYLVGVQVEQSSDYTRFKVYFVKAEVNCGDQAGGTEWRLKVTADVDGKNSSEIANFMSGDLLAFDEEQDQRIFIEGAYKSKTFSVKKTASHTMKLIVSGNNLTDDYFEDDPSGDDKYPPVTLELNCTAGTVDTWRYIDSANNDHVSVVSDNKSGLNVDGAIRVDCAVKGSEYLYLYFRLVQED